MTSSGKFMTNTKVSKKEFINTTNKILKSSYEKSSNEKKITIKMSKPLFDSKEKTITVK